MTNEQAPLALAHVEMCLESLRYSHLKFTEYPYPNETIRARRLREVNDTIAALRALKATLKKAERDARR